MRMKMRTSAFATIQMIFGAFLAEDFQAGALAVGA